MTERLECTVQLIYAEVMPESETIGTMVFVSRASEFGELCIPKVQERRVIVACP
jgi:hypothetical protein